MTNERTSEEDILLKRLRQCSKPELLDLLDDLKLDKDKHAHAQERDLQELVAKELRSVAGYSLGNLMGKKRALTYRQILIRVADKLTPGILSKSPYRDDNTGDGEDLIENYISERVRTLAVEQFKKLPPEKRSELQEQLLAQLKQKGVPAHVLQGVSSALAAGTLSGAVVAPVVATLLFSGFWTWLIGLSAWQLVVGGLAGGGPLGLALASALIANSPGYQKLIPAVVRLIAITHSRKAEASLWKDHGTAV